MNNNKSLSSLPSEEILGMKRDELGLKYLSEFYDERNEPKPLIPLINRCANSSRNQESELRKKFSEAIQWLCENALIAEYIDSSQKTTYFVTAKGVRHIKKEVNYSLTPP